jgi:hypothetical protein
MGPWKGEGRLSMGGMETKFAFQLGVEGFFGSIFRGERGDRGEAAERW